MEIACEGYRVASGGHHQVTFEALVFAVGPKAAKHASYFELCRRKRNTLDYDLANVVTETEVEELLAQVCEFHDLIESWIAAAYPPYAKS